MDSLNKYDESLMTALAEYRRRKEGYFSLRIDSSFDNALRKEYLDANVKDCNRILNNAMAVQGFNRIVTDIVMVCNLTKKAIQELQDF